MDKNARNIGFRNNKSGLAECIRMNSEVFDFREEAVDLSEVAIFSEKMKR